MLAGVLAWLWPIGLGGRMPVGGDATQFSMGLMSFLGASLRAGRLPLWNDLWGFGFPGLAESQMGVFYPPHLLLYGLLSTETAYVTSLVLHTLWAALGARWAARKLGSSEGGAAFAGFAWATCGFFLIHLPHQWGYTVGSWMPWAWGLTWVLVRGDGSRRTPWLLSGVLALQVLPGHFQLAFVTEVGVLAIALFGGGRSVARRLAVAGAVVGVIPLAAMQLWPTWQLARLSESRRDFEYLSGFAGTPLHLVDLVAPGLFHRSPLWRPVAWDPFHTSPEELLGYVGLVPLFLALVAVRRGWKTDPAVRTVAVLVSLLAVLSLGPYVPGFSGLIRVPGFSFFRAPARWGLGTSLALCLLASLGFDRLSDKLMNGRSVRRFAVGGVALVLVVVLGFELALAASRGVVGKPVASAFDRVLQWFPWSDRAEFKPFAAVMGEAYRPQQDLRVVASLARSGSGKPSLMATPTLAGSRFAIYAEELAETGGLLLGLILIGFVLRSRHGFVAGLVVLGFADGMLLARNRPFDLGPARPLVEQSPVLARLAAEPRGTRTLDPALNLFQVAGASPASAYRTLDLPAPGALLQLARMPGGDPRIAQAVRVLGVEIRVLDPLESRAFPKDSLGVWGPEVETISDPALAGWLLGVDYAREAGLREFTLLRPRAVGSRAWLLPSAGLEAANLMNDPLGMLPKFRSAVALPSRSDLPERAEVDVKVADLNPAMVVLSKTFDPGWRAWWEGPLGERREAKVVKVLGGWQGVAVPEPGKWTLHLDYPARAGYDGLRVASVAWSVWLMGFFWPTAGWSRFRAKRVGQGLKPGVVT